MIKFITEEICNEIEPRPGESDIEQKAVNIIYNKFIDFYDEVIKDHFTYHPQGFLDFIWINVVLYILHPLISVIFISTTLGIYFTQ